MDIYHERIKPLLEESGLSDRKLEQEIGLPRGIIYKWNTGANDSYIKNAGLIAKYFGVNTEWLLGMSEQKIVPTVSSEDMDNYELFLLIRAAPDEVKQAVRTLLKSSLPNT